MLLWCRLPSLMVCHQPWCCTLIVLITAHLGVARTDWGQREIRKITPGSYFQPLKLGWRYVLPMSTLQTVKAHAYLGQEVSILRGTILHLSKLWNKYFPTEMISHLILLPRFDVFERTALYAITSWQWVTHKWCCPNFIIRMKIQRKVCKF